ncbi:MAG: DUF4345 domain-containing protein [Rhodospirillales bacterium]
MTPRAERRLLQAAVLLAGIVPVSAGTAGIFLGAGLAGGGSIDLDSHVRYLSGLLLGIGLVFWGTIPRIERRAAIFQALTGIVAIGGLARLLGLFVAGVPSTPMTAALGMELAVTPLLCLWQRRIAQAVTCAARA